MNADLHCHTRISDGSLGIDDIIVLAKKREVTTIAITDHDCLAGTVRGKIIGERHGITVIPGVEISAFDKKRGNKAHLLCYLPDAPDRLEGLCRRNSLSRKKASQYMVLRVAQKYPISADLVAKCAAGSTNVFKQHIMHALINCGLTSEFYGELYHELFSADSPKNVLVNPSYPEPQEVAEAIRSAGGIAVLAHPGFYDNFELLDEMAEQGLIDGVEIWHPMNNEEQVKQLLKSAKKYSLLATGGSDFHGMYNSQPICLGDYGTPQPQLTALLGFKAKKRRMQKKADAEAEAAAAAE